MSEPRIVTLVGYFKIPPSHAEAFRKNCVEMIDLRKNEPGHLASAYSFGADGTAVSREDYDSAEAVKRHMELGSHIFESTQSLVEITGAEVHGPADVLKELRELFSGMSPQFFVTEYGFRG